MRMKTLKILAAGLIVACAFAIMLPDLVVYLSGLWRIILLVVTIIVTTTLLVFFYHKFRAKLGSKNQSEDQENA